MSDALSGRPWAQAPWELVTADISHGALRVALAIQLHRSPTGQAPFPSQQRLASMCRMSVPMVKRAVEELRQAGILRTKQRNRAGGRRSTNEYTLVMPSQGSPVIPSSKDQGSSVIPGPGIIRDPTEVEIYVGSEVDPVPPAHGTRVLALVPHDLPKVNGKAMTATEAEMAEAVLAVWNEATGQTLTARSWLSLVVRRCREHPELGLPELEHLIVATLSNPNPWWDGAPTLNLIFGSDMQFERSIVQVTSNGNGHVDTRKLRYGRGMTSAQIMERYSSR